MLLEGLARWLILGGVSAAAFWFVDLRRRSEGEPSWVMAAVVALAVTIAAHALVALTSGFYFPLALVSVPAVWLPCFLSSIVVGFLWQRHAAKSKPAV
jgi:hypothetical protein